MSLKENDARCIRNQNNKKREKQEKQKVRWSVFEFVPMSQTVCQWLASASFCSTLQRKQGQTNETRMSDACSVLLKTDETEAGEMVIEMTNTVKLSPLSHYRDVCNLQSMADAWIP